MKKLTTFILIVVVVWLIVAGYTKLTQEQSVVVDTKPVDQAANNGVKIQDPNQVRDAPTSTGSNAVNPTPESDPNNPGLEVTNNTEDRSGVENAIIPGDAKIVPGPQDSKPADDRSGVENAIVPGDAVITE